MYKCVIKSGIEHFLLLLGAALDLDSGQVCVPGSIGIGLNLVEIEALLLCFQVHSGILAAYEGNSYLDHNLLTFSDIVIAEPETYIVSGNFACISCVEFILALVRVPGSFCCHRTLFFPVAAA